MKLKIIDRINYLKIPFVDCKKTWKLVLWCRDVRPEFLKKKSVKCTEAVQFFNNLILEISIFHIYIL